MLTGFSLLACERGPLPGDKDGNENNSHTTPVCGDGLVQTGEVCDDGPANGWPGYCTADCSGLVHVCGDGIADGVEECDGDDLRGLSCVYFGFPRAAGLGCTPGCTVDTTGCSMCGNGVVDAGEECDGANLAGQDCAGFGFFAGTLVCGSDCTFDTSGCSMCGNGVIDAGEDCEGANLRGQSCRGLGFATGILRCGAFCTFDTAACSLCGNGVVEAGEECDGSDLAGRTCSGLGFATGTLACGPGCTFWTSGCALCGNGVVEAGEECDGAHLGGQTCSGLGFATGTLACGPGCTFETGGCALCGNGVVEPGEECDGADLGGQTCTGLGATTGTLACEPGCTFDTTGCSMCGNGVIDAGEECDGTNLAGQSCQSFGFAYGQLRCLWNCRFGTSTCRNSQTGCGDGIIGPGEVCDDGNAVDDDGCSNDCLRSKGKIAFVSDRSGRDEVWTMYDDGSYPQQVTVDAPRSGWRYGAHYPVWSPDGRRIVFRYGDRNYTTSTLHVIDADGTGALQLASNITNTRATWARDGSWLIYEEDLGCGNPGVSLRRINADGTGDALFYDGPNQSMWPDYHPFRDLVVFEEYICGGDYRGLRTVDLLGQFSVLTDPGKVAPRWSANGRYVAYRYVRSHTYGVIPFAGGAETLIVLANGGDAFTWGESNAVFYTERADASGATNIIRFDWTGATTPITNRTDANRNPDWHPGDRDVDLDDVLDWQDNCADVPNPAQADVDGDGVGDACEATP